MGTLECGTIPLFYALLGRVRRADWSEAVGFGMGFGAVETFLLGIIYLAAVLSTMLIPRELLEGSPLLRSAWVIPALIVVERTSVLLIDVSSITLIIYALRAGKWGWFWFSFLYKTSVGSTIEGFAMTYGAENFSVPMLWC